MTPAQHTALAAEILPEILIADFGSGRLFWRERPMDMFSSDAQMKRFNSVYLGKEAFAGRDAYGYKCGTIFYKTYKAHRVIWAMKYGEWPSLEIDHINGVPDDNRIENLRVVSTSINARNAKMRTHNTSGANGVNWSKSRGLWEARIAIAGKRRFLGAFANIDDAIAARKAAESGNRFTSRHGLSLDDDIRTSRKSEREVSKKTTITTTGLNALQAAS